MVKVGIVMLFGKDWLGGINYFNNLFNAVKTVPDNRIEFTLFTGYKVDNTKFEVFPPMSIVKSRIFDRYTLSWFCRKIVHRLLRRDLVLERLLKEHDIQLLSHSGVIGPHANLPTISWIPDFQHLHLSTFFSSKEIARRNRNFNDYANWSTVLLLSSHDAFQDLQKFNLEGTRKAKVLNFVVNPQSLTAQTTSLEELQKKYQFSGRFFLLPNQFWAHKNHRVVIEAIAELKNRNEPVLILATGNTEDNRNPQFFSELKAYICKLGVEEQFKILGIVPLLDLYGLMMHADAVINPSLFEGWSTTVEEAKTLNKQILLSDISVHREQAPLHGHYFRPNDFSQLATLIASISVKEKPSETWITDVSPAMDRFKDYGKAYHRLVMGLVGHE